MARLLVIALPQRQDHVGLGNRLLEKHDLRRRLSALAHHFAADALETDGARNGHSSFPQTPAADRKGSPGALAAHSEVCAVDRVLRKLAMETNLGAFEGAADLIV